MSAASAAGPPFKDLSLCLASELDCFVSLHLRSIEGSWPAGTALATREGNSDLCVELILTADNNHLCPPHRTSYKHQSSDAPPWSWDEWISFPVKYSEIPFNTQLAITIWKRIKWKPQPLSGTTFRLFSKGGLLRRGQHKLHLWLDVEADPSQQTCSTPSKLNNGSGNRSSREPVGDEIDRLNRLMNKYERGDIVKVNWLDPLIFKEIDDIKERESQTGQKLFMLIDLPKFDFPILFNQNAYENIPPEIAKPLVSFVYDPDMDRENPVEAKHRRLVRSHRSGPLDRELKPNAKLRDELNRICRYPPTKQLTSEECDLLWRFRFYLCRDKRALNKFIKAVDWNDSRESRQATDVVLPLWTDIDIADALELVGPTVKNAKVRRFAVQQLQKADDGELQLFLLQLVQAIKFEELEEKGAYESSLVEFLTARAINNPVLGNDFHWYLSVESQAEKFGKIYSKVAYYFTNRLVDSPSGLQRRDQLRRQGELVDQLVQLSKDLQQLKEPRPKKIERLQNYLSDTRNALQSFPTMPLPLDASLEVCGILPETATVFKSQLMPLRLALRRTIVDSRNGESATYSIIFKHGDDLRQDQLIMQVICLMDGLLRKENLDLRLTTYKVLATGTQHGMLQFIPSLPLAQILASHQNNLQSYFRSVAPDPDAPYGINPVAMDTYVKSCAGYCVITYLLGIGDRHLDNLLVTPNGNLFHIDFGYILGRDPKPFPPPMKLCKEMVDAMGGTQSTHYQQFKSLCYTAFMILRKSSNLILNLFSLMIAADMPDFKIEPDKVVNKVQEKFRLDLSDEEAIQFFQTLINESVNALFPQLMETVHKWAQYWRK